MKTRAVSFLLALAMILTMVPAQNLQATEPAGETWHTRLRKTARRQTATR